MTENETRLSPEELSERSASKVGRKFQWYKLATSGWKHPYSLIFKIQILKTSNFFLLWDAYSLLDNAVAVQPKF